MKDVRCFVHPAAKVVDGELEVSFSLKRGQPGVPHKFKCDFLNTSNASAQQWREFETGRVLPWLETHEKFSGRNSATSGALLRHNPNGFVCVHGSEAELLDLMQLQAAVPGDNIHMVLPLPASLLERQDHSEKDMMMALKTVIVHHAALNSDASAMHSAAAASPAAPFSDVLPEFFKAALLSEASKLKPHGVLLPAMAAILHSHAMPPRSTHVLLGVSMGSRATHSKLECFGGKRHLGEAPVDGALREFEEETGITRSALHVQCQQPLLVGGTEPLDALFIARPAAAASERTEADDAHVSEAVEKIASLPQFGQGVGSPGKGRGRGRRKRGGGRQSGKHHSTRHNWQAAGESSWSGGGMPSEGMPEDR